MKKQWLIGIGIGLAAVALLALGLALGGGFLRYGGYWHNPRVMMGGDYGTMHPFGGGPLPLLLGVAVIGGILLLAAGLGRRPAEPMAQNPSPREILDRRYAGGEIDHEQYETIKARLDS